MPVAIFGVYCNADMTEGRGPIVLDRLFLTEEDAWAYADEQAGVMGRRPSLWKVSSWKDVKYGDWEVRPLKVY